MGGFVIHGIIAMLFNDSASHVAGCYSIVIGLATCVVELRPEDLPQFQVALKEKQTWLYEHAKVVTTRLGRGSFFLLQGTATLSSSSLLGLALGCPIGVYMMVLGTLLIQLHLEQQSEPVQPDAEAPCGETNVPEAPV